MIKNYLKSAWRNIWKSRAFSIINIVGLAVSLSAVLLIALWVQNQFKYDNFYANQEQIHKMWTSYSDGGGTHDITSYPAADALVEKYPEVAEAARVYWPIERLLRVAQKEGIKATGNEVDPSFLKIFDFPIHSGQGTDALQDKSSIVITKSLAKSLFGEDQALGKTIVLDNEKPHTVTAVIADLPIFTDFRFSYLIPMNQESTNWNTFTYYTYVRLQPDVDLSTFNTKIESLARTEAPDLKTTYHFLYPLSKQHLYARFENGVAVGGKIESVRVVGTIGLLILLIAGVNFVNLSTARGQKRAKEVGVRKVVGAKKSNLIGQFLTESILICFIAGLLAVAIGFLVLPMFNQILDKPLSLIGTGITIWAGLFLFLLFTALLAGIYPAFVLSSYNPIEGLKGNLAMGVSRFNMRSVLVVAQFSITIVLIIASIVMRLQIQYASHRDVGYDTHQMIEISLEGNTMTQYETLKNELASSHLIASVTRIGNTITRNGSSSYGNFSWPGATPEQAANIGFNVIRAEADFVKTLGLTLLDGRDYDYTRLAADSNAILLNESAIKLMGLENPIGQNFTWGNTNYFIAGIFSDFISGSPYAEVTPMLVYASDSRLQNMIVRTEGQHNMAECLALLEQTLKKFNPAYPFNYRFVDEAYAEKFAEQEQTASLSFIFSFLAIFISCLGLLGMIVQVTEAKIKEIGIRKVLGASVTGIITLLSKDFIKTIVVATLIASPIAWWAMNKWLEDFAYRIEIQWWMFAFSGLAALIIALLTVSGQAIRAAIANPVKSLRNE